jgi:hypothetical protein
VTFAKNNFHIPASRGWVVQNCKIYVIPYGVVTLSPSVIPFHKFHLVWNGITEGHYYGACQKWRILFLDIFQRNLAHFVDGLEP